MIGRSLRESECPINMGIRLVSWSIFRRECPVWIWLRLSRSVNGVLQLLEIATASSAFRIGDASSKTHVVL